MPVTEVAAVAALGVVATLAAVRIVLSFVSRTYQRCAACASADRVCDFVVVVMSAGMTAMIVAHDEFPATIGVSVFGICAGWFAYRMARAGLGASARSGSGRNGGFVFHHFVSCTAMIVMSLTMTGGWHHTEAAAAHHAPIASAALNWGLGTYFVVAAASAGFLLTSSAEIAMTKSVGTPAAVRAVTSRAGVAGSEVVMSAAMALMLFQAV